MRTAAHRRDVLCEVNRSLANFSDLDELLRYATRRARELFHAESCVLSLLDRRRQSLYVSAAGGDGSERDARPEGGEQPGPTRTISVPIRTRSGTIGVVEVVDPWQGCFTPDDRELLEALAGDIAVAYEQAVLPGETAELGRVGIMAGLGLAAIGLLLVLGAIFVLEARALPLSELPTRPGTWPGLCSVLAGVVLVAVCRRHGRAKDAQVVTSGPDGSPPRNDGDGRQRSKSGPRTRDECAA